MNTIPEVGFGYNETKLSRSFSDNEVQSIKSIVTAADFIEILNIYALAKTDLGQFDEIYKEIRTQLLSAVISLGNNNELYWYYMGETLYEYLEVDFAAALTFSDSINEEHGADFKYFFRYLRAKRYISLKLGKYKNAVEISAKIVSGYKRYYAFDADIYMWRVWYAISLIESGDFISAMNIVNNELRIEERSDLTTDWQT